MGDSNFAIRLKHFMDSIGISSSQLADRCGVPRPSMSSILSGRNKKISDTLIGQIHAVFPQLNVLWLMFGEGEMFLPSSSSVSALDSGSDHLSLGSEAVVSEDNDSGVCSVISEGRALSEYGISTTPLSSANSSGTPSRAMADDRVRRPFSGSSFTGQNSVSQNSENLGNGSAESSGENLKGLEKGNIEAGDRMNKGSDGDLRTIALMRQIENLKANPRKVTQITIYYDDSTFETFVPS